MILQPSQRMIELREAEAAAEANRPAPVAPPAQPAKPQLPTVVVAKRWDILIRDWCMAKLAHPWLFAVGCITAPWRLASVVWVLTGPRVDYAELDARDRACAACPKRYVYVRRNGDTSEHCGACSCPAWHYSRNWVRNAFARWHCPLRKHPGTYPQDVQRAAIVDIGYDPESATRILIGGGGSGCSGCGCGGNKTGA